MFELNILGSSSATPAFKRHLSAQIVTHNDRLFLIDCGEGTQFQLLKYRIRVQRLDAIFISHLHGDHCFGLVGLLCTLSNQERTRPLKLYCPKGLSEILFLQFKVSDTRLKYPLEIIELNSSSSEKLFENNGLEVSTIPLKHRVYCNGFLFQEKNKRRKFKQDIASRDNIPQHYFHLIKQGNNIDLPDGRKVIADEYLGEAPKSYSYAYCSDTSYTESIIPIIRNVDVLYHESTFLHALKKKAEATLHSTAAEAAMIAKLAGVHKLILGHFSARYQDLSPILEEARSVFPESFLAEEGIPFKIK